MAKQMTFVSDAGVTFEQSYWRPVELLMDIRSKTVRVIFYGYATQETRLADKAPVGAKVYSFSGATYNAYYSTSVLQTKDPIASAYQLAIDTLDTDGKSFFDGARDV